MTGPAGSTGQLFAAEDLVSPGSVGPPPPPLNGPLVIPVGSIVQVLPPGIDWTLDAYRALDAQPHEAIGQYSVSGTMPGRRFYVVDGPLAHVGTDWYLLEVSQGRAPFRSSRGSPRSKGIARCFRSSNLAARVAPCRCWISSR